jgi:hypothetical protein
MAVSPSFQGVCMMSTFDPFRPVALPGCPCSLHRSHAEHDHHLQLQLRVVEGEPPQKPAEGLFAASVLPSLYPRG